MRYLVILFVSWSSVALAGVATVRSGEHEGFTRFVVALSEASDHSFIETNESLELTFLNLESAELSRTFDRVRRERVVDVVLRDQTLVFMKACDCSTDVFPMGDRLIVVDVYDHSVRKPQRGTLDEDELKLREQSYGNVILPSFWENGQNSTRAIAPRSVVEQTEAVGPESAKFVEELSIPVIQQQLAADVGFALTQGMLSHSAAPEPERPTPVDGPGQVEELIEGVESSQTQRRDALVSNLRTSGAIDVTANGSGNQQLPLHHNDCKSMANYDIAVWDPKLPFSEAIAKLRRELVGEFDKLDFETALSLAQTYAFFGFGAESLSIVTMTDGDDDRMSAVRNIANVLEYGQSTDLNSYTFLECGGPLAFWAALSFEELPEDVIFDEDDAIRELNGLPKHLRRMLAPEMSMRLRQRGSVSKAALVMRGAERSEGELSSKGRLENSEVMAAQNGQEQTEADVRDMVALDTMEAPLALISFINQQVKNGEDISSEIALLAESFAIQFRGTDIERDLIAAHMISLAKSGQFEKAFELLYSQPDQSREVLGQVDNLFETLNDAADDVVFLKYAVLPVEDRFVTVSERVRMKMVERTLAIGFDSLAERLLYTVVDAVGAVEYGILKAKLLLRAGEADAALALLQTLDWQEDKATKARAYFAAGAFDEAAEIFGEVGAEQQRFEAVFRASAASADGLEEAEVVSALRRIKEPVQEVVSGSLRSVEDLLAASDQMRADSDLLMNATQLE